MQNKINIVQISFAMKISMHVSLTFLACILYIYSKEYTLHIRIPSDVDLHACCNTGSGLEVIKHFSCSTQLSTKFIQPINLK